jgi:mannose-6-phosphate isomerase-like protein (cupin superfamily)
MKRALLLVPALLVLPGSLLAQQKLAATYITSEQIATVNAQPGTDRQLVSVDIGKLNLAVGIIHRGASTPPNRPTAPIAADQACGAPSIAPPAGELVSGILHDHQTETYVIVSGGGTLVTGGQIIYGRKSAPNNAVTTTLNGPSCSGFIVGSDVVRRQVKTGDVIVIPALVPHGWTGIIDHVDYLSVRPDPDRVLPAGYVHPAIRTP